MFCTIYVVYGLRSVSLYRNAYSLLPSYMWCPPISEAPQWDYNFFFKTYIAASTQEYIGVLAKGAIACKGRECSWGLGALPEVCRDRAKPPTPCPRNGSDREVWERSQALPSARERLAVSLMEVWGLCRPLQDLNLVLLEALFGLSAGVLGVVVLLENDIFDVVVPMVEGIA